MTPGKMASQAGHAFLGAFLLCRNSPLLAEYHRNFPQSPGTKICLKARNLEEILRAEADALAAGLTPYKVVDSGCQNFFDGEPIVTALGIGPASKHQIQHITRKLQLL
jgi:peptidyl-tRNA hydrolase